MPASASLHGLVRFSHRMSQSTAGAGKLLRPLCRNPPQNEALDTQQYGLCDVHVCRVLDSTNFADALIEHLSIRMPGAGILSVRIGFCDLSSAQCGGTAQHRRCRQSGRQALARQIELLTMLLSCSSKDAAGCYKQYRPASLRRRSSQWMDRRSSAAQSFAMPTSVALNTCQTRPEFSSAEKHTKPAASPEEIQTPMRRTLTLSVGKRQLFNVSHLAAKLKACCVRTHLMKDLPLTSRLQTPAFNASLHVLPRAAKNPRFGSS